MDIFLTIFIAFSTFILSAIQFFDDNKLSLALKRRIVILVGLFSVIAVVCKQYRDSKQSQINEIRMAHADSLTTELNKQIVLMNTADSLRYDNLSKELNKYGLGIDRNYNVSVISAIFDNSHTESVISYEQHGGITSKENNTYKTR